ncbi:MAG: metallophosphoesterase [Planctomycetota bacterium]
MRVLFVCCALDVLLLAAGSVLAWRLPRRAAWMDAAGLLVFAGIAAFAFALPCFAFGGMFGVLRGFTHAGFCVILPVAAVRAVRLWGRAGSRWLALALLFAFAAGEAIYVFAREIEPFRLEVTRETVTSPRLQAVEQKLGRPLRVACLADLQTDVIGAHEKHAFDQLVSFAPDMVLMLGDYLQVPRERLSALRPALHEQLARLQAPHGIYAVEGDVDYGAAATRELFAGTAVQVISDRNVQLAELPIDILGLSRTRSRAPFVDSGLVRRIQVSQEPQADRFPILIGHAPDYMLSVVRDGYDPDALMVAGHTHGGQIQIPGFGPLVTLSSVPRWLGGGGVFRHGKAWLVVSRGVGHERGHAPRVRFCCRPQLILLELRGGS